MLVTKAELGWLAGVGGVCAFGMAFFALLPDRELSDDEYVQLEQRVELCPAAQSAMDVIQRDHVIYQSEATSLQSIIKGYIAQDERVTTAHNVQVAKGLIKGPLQKRTCLPLDEPETAPEPPIKIIPKH